MRLILKEERIYDNDIENLSVNEVKSTSAISKKTSKNKKSRRRILTNYKNIKMNSTSFGLKISFLKFLCLFLLQFLSQFVVYLMISPSATRITNMMKVYSIGVELWNCYDSAFVMFYDTILLNNSVRIWDDKRTLDGYYYFKDKIETRVIPNYTLALDYDIGNMTDNFTYALTKVTEKFF